VSTCIFAVQPLLTCASNLYTGENGLGQSVLTWVADSNVTEFNADVASLVQGLGGHGGPTASDYLGYLAFGSEALSASTNVTLSVPDLKMSVTTK